MTDSGLYLPTIARPGENGIREWIRNAATIWNGRLSLVATAATDAQTSADAAADSAANALEKVPATGDFRLMAANTYGAEWLPCDGSSVLRADYPDLFDVIGTTYGANDTKHFTLPNIKAFVLDNSTGFSLDTLEKSSWIIVIRT